MIPRVFHQVWLGGKPLPAKFAAWAEGFRAKHPTWEYRLWNDAAVEAHLQQHFPQHLAIYLKTRSYSQKSDVARHAILAIHGGIYLDTDCECRRPIDFIEDSDELIVAHELRTTSPKVKELYRTPRSELYCVWTLFARPGHPLFFSMVEEIAQRLAREISPDPIINAIDQSGPGAFTDVINRYFASGGTARIVPGPWLGCPDGSSLFRFSRSFMFPELFRTVYVRHRSEASWVAPEQKREWMIRSFFFLGPPKPKTAKPAPTAK